MSDSAIRSKPDKRLAAVCGLYCPACTVYIGTHEDPARLEALAARMGRPISDLVCEGCRAEKRSFFCENLCLMARCAAKRGLEFCGACADYPCQDLKDFQSKMPHRAELWESLGRIRQAGWETWFAEATARHACPYCGTINSAYDLRCRGCGGEQSSEFAARHGKAIRTYFEKAK